MCSVQNIFQINKTNLFYFNDFLGKFNWMQRITALTQQQYFFELFLNKQSLIHIELISLI